MFFFFLLFCYFYCRNPWENNIYVIFNVAHYFWALDVNICLPCAFIYYLFHIRRLHFLLACLNMPLPLFQWTFPSMLRSGGTKYTFCSLLGSDVRSTNFYSFILWTKGCRVWTLCIFYSSVYKLSNLWMLVHIRPLGGLITWVEVQSPYKLGKFLDTKCTHPYMAWKVSRHPLGCISRPKN